MTAAETVPVTSLQRSMVLSSLRAPGSGLYILQAAFEFPQEFDCEVFRAAWRCVSARHSALRTSFSVQDDGEVRQHVSPVSAIEWNDIDCGDLNDFLESDRQRGFDFGRGIPMRFTMLRQASGSACLVWTGHHALLDGRSYAVLWREVFDSYDALRRGETPVLPGSDPFRQHLDGLQRRDPVDAERYWREYLKATGPATDCIVERIRPPKARIAHTSAEESFSLPEDLTNALWSFALREAVTVNTLVLGAWAVLLSRYGARREVVFGVTRTGRHASVPDAKNGVGLFINTVPFRVAVDGSAPTGDWLRRVREDWINGRQFECTPLEQIRAWSSVPAGRPLFDSVLVYDNQPLVDSVRDLGGLAQYCTLSGVQRADAPITLVAYGRPRLSGRILYDAGLFSKETMAALAGHFRTLLASFVTGGYLKMLTAAEENWLIRECNDTTAPFPADLCAHDLFERCARESPASIALEYPGRVISYGELNARANQLARFLQAKGVQPEDLVAVRMERSPAAIVALLGILKAGAAFLPIDPALPAARTDTILKDAQPRLVLTGDLESEISGQADADLPRAAAPHNAAYAVYTSGSTGTPKGLVVTHRSLVNHTLAVTRVFGISRNDRRLQFAPVGSDVFVAEVFNYLSSGATLVLSPGRRSVQEFSRLLDEQRITITAFTGTWWNEWVGALAAGSLSIPRSLRAVIVGMEQSNPAALQTWRRLSGDRIRWFNAYGPSEASPTSTVYEAGTSDYECAEYVPIGQPVANTQAYVLDDEQNLLPAGVLGELYLGGEGIARGYLKRPDLNAERFLKDPFTESGRLYRTADLAFRLPDGNLVFAGRTDRQVKIRGFRVELEEIETVLAQHPAVRQCAVIADGQDSLRAYVCPRDRQAAGIDELRAHLAKRLPSHMVPSRFLFLPEMPLTANGKIDRQSLPRYATEPSFVPTATCTATEKRLGILWVDVLGIAESAAADNFFDLGGDSVRATRLITRINAEFGKELALSDLFRAPTLETLAALLEHRAPAISETDRIAMRTGAPGAPVFLISSTPDDVFRFTRLAERLPEDQPFFGMPVPELETVEAMAASISVSIRERSARGPYILGGHCFGGLVAFETAQRLIAAGEDVRVVILFDTPTPGYPKILRNGHRYWRQLRRGISLSEAVEHVQVVRRLLSKRVTSWRRRTLPAPAGAERTVDPRLHAATLYDPRPIRVPVVQFITADSDVSTRVLDDPRLGWRDLCPNFEVRRVPGAHPTFFLEQLPTDLIGGLREVVAKAGMPAPEPC